MYVLQQYDYQTQVTTFQSFATIADGLTEVRSNKGLTEGQFLEFVFNHGMYERPEVFMVLFEGEIPTNEQVKAAMARVPKR